jgi:tetratricopeptide (TPR) repeat protein
VINLAPGLTSSGHRRGPCRLSLLIAIVALSSCSNRVAVPQLAPDSGLLREQPKAGPAPDFSQGLSETDLQAEAAVDQKCVEAWRIGIAGDPEGAIKQLKELDKEYPRVSTVHFMLGQVLERAGRKKEAVTYYRDAVRQFEFDSMHLFRLAEAMRTTGDARGAIPYYRKLLKGAPEFAEGKLGLAKALLQVDPNSQEAKEEIKQVLQEQPKNKEALALSAGKH